MYALTRDIDLVSVIRSGAVQNALAAARESIRMHGLVVGGAHISEVKAERETKTRA
jgi:hypothetical protein